MKELLKPIREQWLMVKRIAQQECEARNKHQMAQRYHDCAMFEGNETVQQLAEKLTSPQGLEFCVKKNFPNLATFRLFKGYKPERFGVYIDAGQVTISNPGKVLLVGKTYATVNCDSTERHEIATMHGATASIHASKWTVVHTTPGRGTTITKRATDNAIIL
ncbi:MAG: hypothetical protein HUK04_00430 [Bacteroidaceae bacterium]|nr:hypothetical protein [Bacteroidaceae bacterium]